MFIIRLLSFNKNLEKIRYKINQVKVSDQLKKLHNTACLQQNEIHINIY